jgi:hypothetical protein
MAQKRMLNKSISLSAQVNSLTLQEKLIFTWVIPHLDDYGLISSDPAVIKATAVPMIKSITIQVVVHFISHAEELGLVKVYKDCIEFLGFENHQSISQEKKAKPKFAKIPQENSGEKKKAQKSPLQDKIREDKIREDKIREDKITCDASVAGKKNDRVLSPVEQIMDIFYRINPTLNFGNKTTRSACEDMIKKFGLDATKAMAEQVISVQGKKYAPVATTPYQMKEKLAQFKIYFDSKKGDEMLKV